MREKRERERESERERERATPFSAVAAGVGSCPKLHGINLRLAQVVFDCRKPLSATTGYVTAGKLMEKQTVL